MQIRVYIPIETNLPYLIVMFEVLVMRQSIPSLATLKLVFTALTILTSITTNANQGIAQDITIEQSFLEPPIVEIPYRTPEQLCIDSADIIRGLCIRSGRPLPDCDAQHYVKVNIECKCLNPQNQQRLTLCSQSNEGACLREKSECIVLAQRDRMLCSDTEEACDLEYSNKLRACNNQHAACLVRPLPPPDQFADVESCVFDGAC